ncbi:MAG: alpha-amylase family glycosyl hydrolase, partial [Cyanobium sp.]
FLVTPEMVFRMETIYYIVIDRFSNSCPANDRVGRDGLFDPSRRQWGHYWGGDLQGVIEKADYLQALGVSAIWLSPLFEQVDDLVGGTHRCTATGRAISNVSIPTSSLRTTAPP